VRASRTKRALAAILALTVAAGASACGGTDTEESPGTTHAAKPAALSPATHVHSLVMGALDTPEQELLGEIYAQAMELTGFKVEREFGFSSEAEARRALKARRISGYPSYASTSLISLYGYEPSAVPLNYERATFLAREELLKEGLINFRADYFNSEAAVATLRSTARRYGLETISDLKAVAPRLTLAGPPDNPNLNGLEEKYGLELKSVRAVGSSSRFSVLDNREADLSLIPSTAPELAAERDRYVLLRDDKHGILPRYAMWVTTEGLATRGFPDFRTGIEAAQQPLTQALMQDLGAEVEFGEKSPEEVAASYLRSIDFGD